SVLALADSVAAKTKAMPGAIRGNAPFERIVIAARAEDRPVRVPAVDGGAVANDVPFAVFFDVDRFGSFRAKLTIYDEVAGTAVGNVRRTILRTLFGGGPDVNAFAVLHSP